MNNSKNQEKTLVIHLQPQKKLFRFNTYLECMVLRYKKFDSFLFIDKQDDENGSHRYHLNTMFFQRKADLLNKIKQYPNIKFYITAHRGGLDSIRSTAAFFKFFMKTTEICEQITNLVGHSGNGTSKNNIEISLLSCKSGSDMTKDGKQLKQTSFAYGLASEMKKFNINNKLAKKITIKARGNLFHWNKRHPDNSDKVNMVIINNSIHQRHVDMDVRRKILKYIKALKDKLTDLSDKKAMNTIKNKIGESPYLDDFIEDCEQIKKIVMQGKQYANNTSLLFEKKCHVILRKIKSIQWRYLVFEIGEIPPKPNKNGKDPSRFRKYRNDYSFSVVGWTDTEKKQLRLIFSIYKNIIDYRVKGFYKGRVNLPISCGYKSIVTTSRLKEVLDLIVNYMTALITTKGGLAHIQPANILNEIKNKMTEPRFFYRYCVWSRSRRKATSENKQFYQAILLEIDNYQSNSMSC